MKRFIFIIAFISLVANVSAQKSVRKAIRDGNKLYNEKLYGKAGNDYSKAIAENPAAKEAVYNLANSYYKQGRWDEALSEYKKYLDLEKDDPKKMSSVFGNMGNTYLKKKANEKDQNIRKKGQENEQQEKQEENNLQMSMEAYKQALRLNPKDDEVRYNLAVVQKMIKDQSGGGGGGSDKNEEKKDDKKEQEKQDKNQNNGDKPEDRKEDPQNRTQMSGDNIQQILDALEQDEKQTQQKVKQAKIMQQQRQNDRNKRNNKDW